MDKYDIRVYEEDFDHYTSYNSVSYIISSVGIWIHDVNIDGVPVTVHYSSGSYKKLIFMGAKDGKERTG